jgi:hypothetical protein
MHAETLHGRNSVERLVLALALVNRIRRLDAEVLLQIE